MPNTKPATHLAVYFKPERNAKRPWFAVVSETTNGKRRRIWSPGQSSKAEAKAWAWAHKRDGKQDAPAAPAPMTFGDWLDRWRARHDASKSTIETYEGLFRLHVKPALGSVEPADLAREQIDEFLRALGLAHHTKTTIKSLIRRALAEAVEEGLIAVSPAATLRKLARDRKTEPAKAERQMFDYLWSLEDWRMFVKAADGSPFLPVFSLLLATGARLGEVMALRWSDVDLDAGSVSITKSRGKHGTGGVRSLV